MKYFSIYFLSDNEDALMIKSEKKPPISRRAAPVNVDKLNYQNAFTIIIESLALTYFGFCF